MSFPYIVDLSFGSEKPTADNISRISLGKSSGGGDASDLPTTPEELDALIEENKVLTIEPYFDDDLGKYVIIVSGTTKSNIKGFVAETYVNDESVLTPVTGTFKEESDDGLVYTFEENALVIYVILYESLD